MCSDSIQDALRVVKETAHGLSAKFGGRLLHCQYVVGTTILMRSKMRLRLKLCRDIMTSLR